MICPNCNSVVPDTAKFCTNCQTKLFEEGPVETQEAPQAAPQYTAPTPQPAPQPVPQYTAPTPMPVPQPVPQYNTQVSENNIPPQYRPLGMWAFWGYSILFSIPIVGFILLIVFSCSKSNLCRRNYARSYWCWYIIYAIIGIVILVISLVTGGAIFASSGGLGAIGDFFRELF